MAEPELDTLLAPISADAPCGPDLEYDPAFQAMLQAGAGKPERQYGDNVYPAEPPDWPTVHEHAAQLATRTRDLRVAVWLARSGARLKGLAGAVTGLRLVQGLVEQHWAHVHPPLDASDNNDPTARVMALLALSGLDASQAPDLAPLKKLLQRVADAGRKAAGGESLADAPAAAAASSGARAPGTINSREDASRALERICEWIERNEPSNPAPLLIRRAQRLMSKSFMDIIRDLAPDGLSQVEKIAGTGNT